MKHLSLLLVAALLPRCGVPPAPSPSPAPTVRLEPASTPGSAPYSRAVKSDVLEFQYAYPVEVAAIPALVARLRIDEARILAEAIAAATEDRRLASENGRPFHGHSLSKSWELTGQSDRLLALVVEIGSFTGGAHGNRGFSTLLWDRVAGREVVLVDLFGPGALDQVRRAAFCQALDTERLKRRQGEKLGTPFDDCPASSELAVSPLDHDGNGRFDHIRFIAAPYVAGPWAEGDYVIDLPVNGALVQAAGEPYRSSFEAHLAQ